VTIGGRERGCWSHASPARRGLHINKRGTGPKDIVVRGATTTVLPLIATEAPKPWWVPEAVSFAVSVMSDHPPAGSTNTYAAPRRSAPVAPATTVLPLMATDEPRRSLAPPSEAVSLAV